MAKSPVTCLFLMIALLTLPAFGQRTVTGVVLDSAGVPVENASVEAVPKPEPGVDGIAGTHHWIKADARGWFHLQLSPGHYQIVAKRESEGYPDPNFIFNFDRTAVFPEVSVENTDITGVRVRFGTRGGFLHGTLRTQRDRNPVPHGTVTIRDARNTAAYVQLFTDSGGHFQLAVPSKPVLLSGAAPGHIAATFGKGQELTLLPGEHVSLVIELDPQ